MPALQSACSAAKSTLYLPHVEAETALAARLQQLADGSSTPMLTLSHSAANLSGSLAVPSILVVHLSSAVDGVFGI